MALIQRTQMPNRRSGKTTRQIEIANQFASDGYKVLFVAGNYNSRNILLKSQKLHKEIIIVGCSKFDIGRGLKVDVIVIDNDYDVDTDLYYAALQMARYLIITNTEVHLLDENDPWLYFLATTQFNK